LAGRLLAPIASGSAAMSLLVTVTSSMSIK
jgi:hypothetical protein